MILRSRRSFAILGVMIATFFVLIACGSTGTVAVNPTSTATSAPTATATTAPPTATPTHVPPTATPAPVPGVCNASDFPTSGIPGTSNGSPDTFAVPPLTYYHSLGGAAGSHPSYVCSSGNPSSILNFLKTSVPAGGWKITGTTSTTINAEKPDGHGDGFCYTNNITVGSHAGYPGEWDYVWHIPAATCV
jgi:hypothetical protein